MTWHRTPRHPATVALSVLAAVLSIAGLTVMALGLAQQSEPDGYLTSPTVDLRTTTSAMTTTEVEVSTGQPADPSVDVGDLARVRIRASAADDAAPFFLGIAPTDRVRAYLRDVRHDELASLDADPPGASFRTVEGRLAPPAPADQRFWSASALSSGGVATLERDKRSGAWSAVAMSADGSPGLVVRADVGLRFAFLLPVGAALLAGGLACSGASVLVHRQRRTRLRSRPSEPSPYAAARRDGRRTPAVPPGSRRPTCADAPG